MQNGYVESFNGRMPDELLNESLFFGLEHARSTIAESGRVQDGLNFLRRAVDLDDNPLYDEPWGWMQPTRHALGALLMDAERQCRS